MLIFHKCPSFKTTEFTIWARMSGNNYSLSKTDEFRHLASEDWTFMADISEMKFYFNYAGSRDDEEIGDIMKHDGFAETNPIVFHDPYIKLCRNFYSQLPITTIPMLKYFHYSYMDYVEYKIRRVYELSGKFHTFETSLNVQDIFNSISTLEKIRNICFPFTESHGIKISNYEESLMSTFRRIALVKNKDPGNYMMFCISPDNFKSFSEMVDHNEWMIHDMDFNTIGEIEISKSVVAMTDDESQKVIAKLLIGSGLSLENTFTETDKTSFVSMTGHHYDHETGKMRLMY